MKSLILSLLLTVAAASPLDINLGSDQVARKPKQPACSHVSKRCTATKQLSRATSYCASYLGTPISTSYTTTATSTVAPTCSGFGPLGIGKRAATTDVPLCFGPQNKAGKSSACSCLSIPATLTITTGTTSTVTGPFSIMGTDNNGNPNYATYTPQASPGFDYVSYDTIGDSWYLGDDGGLYDSSHDNFMTFEYTDTTGSEPVLLQPAAGVASSGGYQPLRCGIDDATCRLDCVVNGNSNNFECYRENEWYISPESLDEGQCNSFQPKIVPAL